MKQNVVLSILTPFSSKSAEKWEGAAQKTELDEGGSEGGLKIAIYVIILVLYPFSPVFKPICLFSRSRNPFWKVLKKYDISSSQKMLFYDILGREGAFVDTRETICSFDVL